MKIMILGTGCAGCTSLYETVLRVVAEKNIEAEVVKETDMAKIIVYNVLSLPGLVIDGRVVSTGKRLSESEVAALLAQYQNV